jgi:hypothetical protein
MKLFIFKPSKHWSYCGGGAVIAAKSFDGVDIVCHGEELGGVVSKPNFFRTEKEVVKKRGENTFDCWVLVAKYDVPKIKEEKVILYNFNWA